MIIFLLLVAFCRSYGQEWKAMGDDEIFAVARQEAFAGHKTEAETKLRFLLERHPAYDDARILLARIYSWDRSFDTARKQIQPVLERDSGNREALNALADIELWSGNREAALRITMEELAICPRCDDLLYREARILVALGRVTEAVAELDKLLRLNPAHKEGRALYDQVRKEDRKYNGTVSYGTDIFSRIFGTAYYASAEISRTDNHGSAHLRLNHARRFGSDGYQLEVDLYPKISDAMYGYVNYGFSASDLYPSTRLGGELFIKLHGNLESSAGIRYMDFGEGKEITAYTAAFGWYFRNYWVSVRPFVTTYLETEASLSTTLSIRRYLGSAENYIGLSIGIGFSPDLTTMETAASRADNTINLLESRHIGVQWQDVFHETWTFNLSMNVGRQGLSFGENEHVIIMSPLLSIRKKF